MPFRHRCRPVENQDIKGGGIVGDPCSTYFGEPMCLLGQCVAGSLNFGSLVERRCAADAGQASNRLVRPHMHAAVCATAPELRSGLRGLSDGAAATLDSLLDLNDALLDRVPDRSDGALAQPSAAAAAVNGVGKKRGRDVAAQEDSLVGENLLQCRPRA